MKYLRQQTGFERHLRKTKGRDEEADQKRILKGTKISSREAEKFLLCGVLNKSPFSLKNIFSK